jgi:hypothetical protein
MSNSLISSLIEQLTLLPDDLQRQVLEFVRGLKSPAGHGVPGDRLLRFAGSIPLDDLELMRQAIDKDCRTIDPNEW